MKRRTWVLTGGAVVAGAAGMAWRQAQDQAQDRAQQRDAAQAAQAASKAENSENGANSLWAMQFTQPDDKPLAMASLRGKPLLLNFWGTWCPPCIKEMPELDRFAKQFASAGWRVLGLAVDNPSAVREFLARTPVSYTIAMAGFEGSALTRKLGNSQGGLPFTVALSSAGAVVQQKAGATDFEELSRWAKAVS
jgi:thiol-disulfide isomerase/thioredoxin